MLTIEQLFNLLALNTQLLKECTNWQRKAELLLHRSLIKDCLIEELGRRSSFEQYVKVS